MGISSLGVGSSILTQDVLDQLRDADEAGKIRPITLDIANETDKQDAFKIVDATMTNFIDSINAVKTASLWDERKSEVTTGTSVEVSAISKTDVQDFSLNVTALATKQIEQSGSFTAKTETIGNGSGILNLNIDSEDFEIAYDDTTTLDDLKKLINDTAGDKVDATIVQIATGDYRLFISSVDTGTTQNITLTDKVGSGEQLKDARLTTGLDVIDLGGGETTAGKDSAFTFNGQAITRTSNKVDDLITGLTITLKEEGVSLVSISQDRTSILEKFDSFVEKYNSTITELNKMTKPSVESDERGIFSADSTMKGMKRAIQDMLESVGGGVGSMVDYGFSIDQDGKMTLDTTVLEDAMDTNPENVQAFFSGGDFTNPDDGVVTTLDGTFAEMSTIVESYTKTNQILDQLKDSIGESLKSLEERKESATERLDAKYEIMKKQWAAYDLVINQLNSASSMFVQIANAQTAAQSS